MQAEGSSPLYSESVFVLNKTEAIEVIKDAGRRLPRGLKKGQEECRIGSAKSGPNAFMLGGHHFASSKPMQIIAVGRKSREPVLFRKSQMINSQVALSDLCLRAADIGDLTFNIPTFLSFVRDGNSANHQFWSQVNLYRSTGFPSLPPNERCGQDCDNNQIACVFDDLPLYFIVASAIFIAFIARLGIVLLDDHRYWGGLLCSLSILGFASLSTTVLFNDPLFWRAEWLALRGRDPDKCKYHNRRFDIHGGEIVPQKHLTNNNCWGTVIDMANVLNTDKQITVISALAEGSSIRSIERITGVHRDTIMRLGVKVGQGCAKMLDSSMRELPCNRLELDEIWGFIGKKDRNVREGDDGVGSIWTFCAIDAETKLVPAFKCGNRDAETANEFVQDVASRMAYRVQISTDGLHAYVAAMDNAFGEFVDYGQIVKTYGHEEANDHRRYSAPKFVSSEKKVVVGNPDERLISTSYVERLNATTRLHMRRLTRLTLAFSKKRENFEAAVALHFAYYNFVRRHNTLRCTPAMAAGVTSTFWGVGDLLEAVA
jgi:IS1 family transposase